MTNKLNDINIQAKDFFRSGNSGAVEKPQNPYNILWIIENCEPKLNVPSLNKLLKECIKNDVNYTHNRDLKVTENGKIYSLNKTLMNSEYVLKRLTYLQDQGLKLNSEGNAIVRYGSLDILKKAIECGLNINYIDEKTLNYPLRTALVRKKTKIGEYLYSLPNINKDYIDKSGYNIVHLAINREAWNLVKSLWKDNPEKFFEESEDNKEIALDFFKKTRFSNVPNKHFKEIQTIIKSLIVTCSNIAHMKVLDNNLVNSDITHSVIEKNQERLSSLDNFEALRELKIMAEYENIDNILKKDSKDKINKKLKI